MLNFLHNFLPQSILLDLGWLKIHWYGLIISLALLAGFFLFKKLALKRGLPEVHVYNLTFYLIIFGFSGARLFHVFFYNWPYFKDHLWQIFAVWNGGLAISGGIMAGLLTLYFYAKKNQLDFWAVADPLAVAVPLAQAIGRFGNYFNQELFGRPCFNWWCVPVEAVNRPAEFLSFAYFQPLFLYEAILNLVLFFILLRVFRMSVLKPGQTVLAYLGGYAVIRFLMEFLRLDTGAVWFGLKPLQWLCAAVLVAVVMALWQKQNRRFKSVG